MKKHQPSRPYLIGMLVCGIGGWYFGTALKPLRQNDETPRKGSVSVSRSGIKTNASFAEGSPRALWVERVKKTQPRDFQQRVNEWEELFGNEYYDGYFISPRAEAALRWVYGMWLTKDPDGFLQACADISYTNLAAEALVELRIDIAVDLLNHFKERNISIFLAADIAKQMAEQQPLLYLQWNPHGIMEMDMGRSMSDDWVTAIKTLAKTDAIAAGNACLQSKVEDGRSMIYEAMKTVAHEWQAGGLSFSAWAHAITDPHFRSIANHVWLGSLSESDPFAAWEALGNVKLEYLENGAAETIVRAMTKTDPLRVFQLLKEKQDFFAKLRQEGKLKEETNSMPDDPFAEPPPVAEVQAEEPEHPSYPYEDLFDGSEFSYGNSMGSIAIQALREYLPREPSELILRVRALMEQVDTEPQWRRMIEEKIISESYAQWSAEDCMKAAKLWANDPTSPVDEIMKNLASTAAKNNPHTALSLMKEFPQQMQSTLLNEIILKLPAEEMTQRNALLRQLPAESWDWATGRLLADNAQEYATLMATMPFDPSNSTLISFAANWSENDPEAAAAWLSTLADESKAPVAETIAEEWFRYDGDSASAWVDTLPPGSIRDAALKVRNTHASKHSDYDALHQEDRVE